MLTPQIKSDKLRDVLGLEADLYLKHEDMHPYGSHKGRSIPLMMEKYAAADERNFVISSSGNAALAGALAAAEHNRQSPYKTWQLKIFVGKNIDREKLEELKKFTNEYISLEQVENPKQMALAMEKEGRAKNLRQSTDDTALLGYAELSRELAEIIGLSAVFVPTSSGTTAQGLYEGFKKLGLNPQIHIVQTPACHVLADAVSQKNQKSKIKNQKSLANAIVDKIGHRKLKIIETIKNSRGNGWIAEDKDILEAQELAEKLAGIKISPNSALSLAGLRLALKNGAKFDGPVVCLLTGK